MRRVVRGLALLGLLLCAAPEVFAQTTGIAGVARDTSGAVLPGVTVEASSPALIERVRSVTTDSQGVYRIIDLRPGTYTVTFSLPGFSTIKREGIELQAQFVATVNGEMSVGALEETIVVSGATPLVDTQNVVRRNVVQKEQIDAMPTSKNWSTIGVMTVGVFSNQSDVGGSAGEHQNQLKAHGGSFNDRIVQLDGLMLANMACGYSCTGLSTNDASTQELSYEFGAISAETSGGGVRVNIIPKEGGNRFSGSGFFNFANDSLQGNNIGDDLIAQGITTGDSIVNIYDGSAAIGGPLKQDKLWFFTAHRYWGYEQVRTNTFEELNPYDLKLDFDRSRPGTEIQKNKSSDARLTWQISPKNRLSVYYNWAPRTTDNWGLGSTVQPGAAQFQNIPLSHFETGTFRSTLTTRMLFEAAAGNMTQNWTREAARNSPTSQGYPVTDQLLGVRYRAYDLAFSQNITSLRSYRSSLSYVTGSHSYKFGMTLQEGPSTIINTQNFDTALIVRDGDPFQVTVRTTPYTAQERLVADLGIYAMDTWTIKRLTVNAGVRFDYLNNKVPAQSAPGGRWIGPRSFPEMTNVPNWKDIGPRLGVAYDLFGNGKTALKATWSRYVQTSTVGTARLLNPFNTTVNNATRPWTDLNSAGLNCYARDAQGNKINNQGGCDDIPQLNELGPLSQTTFGQVSVVTQYDPDTLNGWFKRRNNWEVSTSITQQLTPRMSVDVAYFRRMQGRFTTTDNLLINPSDFQEYCITAPLNPNLPDGGGYPVCGLYDITPTKFGIQDNLVTYVSNFNNGKQTEVFNGVDVAMAARLRDVTLTGGFATGNTSFNGCDANVDNPNTGFGLSGSTFAYCNYDTSWLTQAKLTGAYTLPWQGIQLGGVLQNLPGQQVLAQWAIVAAQAQPSLGRPLAGGGSRTVPLIKPGTMYTPRRTQVDLRASKSFRMGSKRLQVMADIFNAFNSSAMVGATSNAGEPPAAINTTFSTAATSQWLRPLNILQARYVKFGAQITF